MAEYYPHIRWRRLPEISPRRKRKQSFGNSPPFRPSPSQHAAVLGAQLDSALQSQEGARHANGIDPGRLLVLSFVFEDINERDLLEKIGLQVVQEKEVSTPVEDPKYVMNLTFSDASKLTSFKKQHSKHGVSGVETTRVSSGGASTTKLDVCFDDLETAKRFSADTALHQLLGIQKKTGAQRRSSQTSYRLLVQFPDAQKLKQFQQEFTQYNKTGMSFALTDIQRQGLFDALESIALLGPEDRKGGRLLAEGVPKEKEFYIDVDLWHPGSSALIRAATDQFAQVVSASGGRITDQPQQVAGTLLLTKVKGSQKTLDALARYDRVARVDLPPVLKGIELRDWVGTEGPAEPEELDDDGPLACVVDSGLVAGHPFLSGLVIEEHDFDSGENTTVDRIGHGTHVAGIVAYGDTQECISKNEWTPKVRLLSAKVMKRMAGQAGEPDFAGFADEERVETQIRKAIRYFHKERKCRVFNISFGNFACCYSQGGQLPWAFVLDELAKELDIVIVVAAGNVPQPAIPSATTEEDFQKAVRDQLFTPAHFLIDPASAVLALTVGSLSRPNAPLSTQNSPGTRQLLGSPGNAPSPFTRTSIVDSSGDGLRRVVKPELVWYGGNYSLSAGRQRWTTTDPGLGEVSLKHDFRAGGGRLLAANSGTSCSAPFVTHVAALVEENLRKETADGTPSANLIRAMVVHSARTDKELENWLCDGFSKGDGEERMLRSVGYGRPDPVRAMFSEDHRSVLYAEDELLEDHFHVYELEIPDNFIEGNATRLLRVTLAYDPPVSGTRKEYLARTMSFDLYRGLTLNEINLARSGKFKTATKVESKKEVEMRPPFTTLQWSTIQSAVFTGKTQKSFEYRSKEEEPVLWHIVVGSTHRFEMGAAKEQKYALVVSIEHSNNKVKIHQPVRAKNTTRLRQYW